MASLSLAGMVAPRGAIAADEPDEAGNAAKSESPAEIIDVHQHLNFHARSHADFIAHQKRMGVTRTVLLPSGSALSRASTLKGKANGLAARVFGTQASFRLAEKHPDLFVPFCNEVPDLDGATDRLEKWLEYGARGIGEVKFHLDCDSAPLRRFYDVAKAYGVPVLLHFQHGTYNMGFDRFHKILEAYPEVTFFGHAQTMWGHIDAEHDPEVMYPEGPVTPGGLTDRYLADYPNFYGDMSAGSGRNALDRDPDHAAAFLDRHQDKLCLGTDCADAVGTGEKCSGSGQIANVKRFAPDLEAQAKIFSKNTHKLIDLS